MSETYVLDASALLCFLKTEPGWEVVAGRLTQAAVCSVNLAEVVTKLVETGYSDSGAVEAVDDLLLPVIPFDADLAVAAGLMRRTTRHLGLSLGDRACLALAMREGAVALTADRAWLSIPDIRVELVRP